jgi:uncharacterized membrane protein YdbT with pleckstrin-like domain
MLRFFPLLLASILLYNVLIFAGPALLGVTADAFLARHALIPMFSGEDWIFSVGDAIIIITLILLFFEVVKATRTDTVEVINHALSMLTFVGALVEFIVLKGFATSTFFLITIMAFFDVVAGFTISIVAAKRDLGVSHGLLGTN